MQAKSISKALVLSCLIGILGVERGDAQNSGLTENIFSKIDKAAEKVPARRRSDVENAEILRKQELGDNALRISTQLTAPNIVGGMKGILPIVRGYYKKLTSVLKKEVMNYLRRTNRDLWSEQNIEQNRRECYQVHPTDICERRYRKTQTE
ncbi:hypothetical protein [Roseobacter sp.]|uniref:hypothetical protein n=1 Tax=Roseobacter sp. TaxID=1907202 RepID=UPI00296766CE|nr:hypothetical protein [Roseobacter sp.]MDW3181641.1 hypothetical protein [Roseobacter sp.]